jgi:hypothetical protein
MKAFATVDHSLLLESARRMGSVVRLSILYGSSLVAVISLWRWIAYNLTLLSCVKIHMISSGEGIE